ncbi:MAG: SpoIIE family protein phosphatase [Faecalibacterium sp.]|nr:SpoIIE family protein phosphatase [Ruminococcus sp.]MCM1393238.1 SpoIIE family protein phosphatase [Ruminococcus sp.]MCM1486711.1 SpoIIE family protein phosphatase [Faecalibacterium sp.]
MNTTTLKKKPTSADKLKEKGIMPLMKPIATALIGFSLAQLDALGSMSPFACAFLAGIDFEYCFAGLIGSAIGYFVSSPWQTALRYLAALFIVAMFKLVVLKRFGTSDRIFVCASVSFCAILCSGVATAAFTGIDFISVLFTVAEAAISACAAYFLMKSLKVPILSIGIRRLSMQDNVSIVFCICVFLMCFSGLNLGSIAPARIIAAMVVIFAAQYKGITAASVAGVCAGIALSVAPSIHHLFPCFALGGLVAGIFAPLGQYTTALSFAVTASIATILNGFENINIFTIVETIIAAAAYAVIPSKWITELQNALENSGLISDEQMDRKVCASLQKAAKTVGEVSSIVSRVSERLDNVINPEVNKVFAKLQQNVCYGCNRKVDCWNKRFNETAYDIMTLAGIQGGENKKIGIESRCIRKGALLAEIEKYYTDFVGGMAAKMKVKEMRNIVSDQFSGMAQYLGEIATQIGNSRVEDAAKSRTIKTALQDAGIYVDSLGYYTNPNSRITIESIVVDDDENIDQRKMKQILEFTTGRRFERPEILTADLRTTIIFNEHAVYKVNCGYAQRPYKESKVCGDSIATVTDQSGVEYAIISDGMGTGSRAAIDATMTASLMEKLIASGFSFESALRMVNSALIVKSTDESIATVDGIGVNIYTGEADFYKAGAAISFIRHGNEITTVEEASMPIGILRNIIPAHKTTVLEAGNIVLLVSDGVTVGDCGWISDELLAWSTNNMNDLAAHISSLAKLRSDETNADDITVVAVKLMRNS